jgi:hypothetical protein
VQVATTAPETLRGLFAVGPQTAKVLAVVALNKTSLNSVKIDLDNLFKAIRLEYFESLHFLR